MARSPTGADLAKSRRRKSFAAPWSKRHAGIQGLGRARGSSLRASATSGLAMTDCKIPVENLLPGVEGFGGLFPA